MKIFVDADSCPRDIRGIIVKAGKKRGVETIFIANRKLQDIQAEGNVRLLLVPAGEGAADDEIKGEAVPGDLVITRDIPLAADLLNRGIIVINDRGDRFSAENIRERLSMRHNMKEFRETGLAPSMGGRRYGPKDKKKFADTFSRELDGLMK